ncbi:hypothetical protein CCACVL1_26220, partial [Corchorus capsularis]
MAHHFTPESGGEPRKTGTIQ